MGALGRGRAGRAVSAPDRTPVHLGGEVLARRTSGAYTHLSVLAPAIAERFRPGNVVAVSVGHPVARSRLARRSFWIHEVKPVGGRGLALGLVVERRGAGSQWLASAPVGTPLELTGPLGRPFALPKAPVSCLLVGHEHAAAPIFPLALRLRERGCTVTLLLSARDEAHLMSALEARRSARAVTVVTGDGSVGLGGDVAASIAPTLASCEADVVYAAGPTEVLHAAAVAAEEAGAWSQTALEVLSPCATGLCHGCGVPVVDEAGAARWARACTDGPVLRGDRVRWADLEAGTP